MRPAALFCCFATRMAVYHFRLFDLHGWYVSGRFARYDDDAGARAYANDLLMLRGVTYVEIRKDGQPIGETKRTFGHRPRTPTRSDAKIR